MSQSPDGSPFDDEHYASTLGRKLVRAVELGPRYYLLDLPRYFRLRAGLGLGWWDLGAVVSPLREFQTPSNPDFAPPPGYAEALASLGRAGVRVTMPPNRLAALAGAWWAARDTPGDIIECGSYRGATALLLATLGSGHGLPQRVLMLDTFAGAPVATRYDLGRQSGEFRPPTDQMDLIRAQAETLRVLDRIEVHAGLFERTFSLLQARRPLFSLVHIDANMYESTWAACEFTVPRIGPGGIVVFDDYNGVCDLGARLAIDRYLAQHPLGLRSLAGHSAYARVP